MSRSVYQAKSYPFQAAHSLGGAPDNIVPRLAAGVASGHDWTSRAWDSGRSFVIYLGLLLYLDCRRRDAIVVRCIARPEVDQIAG